MGQDASTNYRRSSTSFALKPSHLKAWFYHPDYPAWLSIDANIVDDLLWAGPIGIPNKLEDSTLRDQALTRVKRRINNMTESYQSLIPLAELRELRGLVGSMTHVTTDTVKMIADLRRTKGRSLFTHVSKLWLTYSFGISPMMRDARDLSRSIWTYLTSGDKLDRVQGTASKTVSSLDSGSGVTGGVNCPVKYTIATQSYLSYRFIGGWKFNLRSSNDYNALAHFGITPPALVPALWETTAFSWVADYFSTLGDFLEDQFVGHAGSPVYIVENRKSLVKTQCTHVHFTTHPEIAILENTPGTCDMERWDFQRSLYSGLPSRILRWKTMDEMGLNGVTKLLNLAAVLMLQKK